MFPFHKPKTYRSVNGCCICRAKSSSSRFTDSGKYEQYFHHCFGSSALSRAGEICNACVLLVKRSRNLKKVQGKQIRDWEHVLDSRIGPGNKHLSSRARSKKKKKMEVAEALFGSASPSGMSDDVTDSTLFRALKRRTQSPSAYSDDISVGEDGMSDHASSYGRRSPNHGSLSEEEYEGGRRRKTTKTRPKKARNLDRGFFDLKIWREQKICCGTVYTGGSMVIVEMNKFKPCKGCKRGSIGSSGSNSSNSNSSASTPMHTNEDEPQQLPIDEDDCV